MPVAAIILAAGGSRRLGQAKQLLAFHGETLVARAIRLANEAGASPVLVGLGAHVDTVSAAIGKLSCIPIFNDRWRQGIASSIVAGMEALSVCAPEAAGVLLMGCDQPRLSADHLGSLIRVFSEENQAIIAASSYAAIHGIPAVFPWSTFAELRALRGDKGARTVIDGAPCPVVGVEFPGGEIDIDSPEDLALLE